MLETNVEQELIQDIAGFELNPYGYVLYAYPWGEGELEGYSGPDEWQTSVLLDIGQKLKSGHASNFQEVIREAVASGHGVGKLHSYHMEFDTPAGRMCWGDIKIGSYVFGADGNPTKVVACHHYRRVPMYRVRFDDGSYTDVSSGHLWSVRGRQERRNKRNGWRTLETIELLKLGVKRSNGCTMARQWEIPVQGAAAFPEQKTPLHPYLLGIWLGDGSKRTPRYTKPYPEIADKLRKIGYSVSTNDKSCHYVRGVSQMFRGGVFDRCSSERYIPDEYKYNGIAQRLDLLAGLLDSDGEVHVSGSIGYSTTSKQLAEDVLWLARSLGCKAMMQATPKQGWYYDDSGERVNCQICYRMTINAPFNPFTVEYRRQRYKPSEHRYVTRWIDAIEALPPSDGMCITVEHPDGMYLANDFIVTHNSALVSWLVNWAMDTHEDTRGIVTANTDTQLRTKTWPEIQKWSRIRITAHWTVVTATAIYTNTPGHESNWRIDAVPWSKEKPEAFAGLHNKGKRILMIFDEASTVDDKIWEVAEGAMTDENTQIVWCVFGNPTRNTGRFRECWRKFKKLWKAWQVDSRNARMSNKHLIEEWIDTYGIDSDFIKVRVRGMFPVMSSRQFISVEDVDAAYGRHLRPEQYNFAPKILTVDPAWEGDDDLVIALRQGLAFKILRVIPKNDNDIFVANIIAQLEDLEQADGVIIDAGYGTGIKSAGDIMGRKWLLVWFQSKSPDPGCLNMRAYIWREMRDWLKEGGAIPQDNSLYEELVSPEIINRNDGIIQLESKKDMKARGLPSPNKADALALSFAYEIKKKERGRALGRSRPVANTEYDLI